MPASASYHRKEEKIDKPRPVWSKPVIRVMTVEFTQYGTGRMAREESPDQGNFYTPPS